MDFDARVVARAREIGKPVYYGDASRAEYLRRCAVETARAVVVTMDSPRANETVVRTTRMLRPDITLVARARDADHAHTLYELGVTDAVPETIEASLQLSEAVLVDIGVPMGFVIASIHEKRDEYRKILAAAARRSGRDRSAARGGADGALAFERGGQRRVDRHRGARDHVPAGERQPEDSKLNLVAIDHAGGVQRLHQVVDVDRAAERPRAGGRARPPMLLDADVIEGEADVGEKDQGEENEQRPRGPCAEQRARKAVSAANGAPA